MRSSAIAAALFIGMVGSATAAAIVAGDFPANAPVDFPTMHKAVSAELTEPNTAQYKRLILVDVGQGPIICGWLNAVENGNTSRDYPFLYEVDKNEAILFPDYDPDDLLGAVSAGVLEGYGCGPAL